MSNRVWIESHLEGSGHSFSFEARAAQAGCGGVFHGESGNITAPKGADNKYPNGIRCVWDIETQPGYKIDLNFSGRFDIETSDNCQNDFIQIVQFDMATSSWQWSEARHLCGRSLPYRPDLSNANKLKLVFRSNNDINGDGFTVYKSFCKKHFCY